MRFPIPQDECAAVLDAVRDDSARLGVDASRIAIGGASAEAALAAAVTLRTVADGHPPWQTLLVYPMLQLGQQPDRNTPPRVDDGEAAMLTPNHLPIPVAPPGQPSTARGPTLEDTEILSTDPGGLAALYLRPQSADPTTHTCERLVELTEWLPGWAWWGSIGRRRPRAYRHRDHP
ncbi:alpha/beta hydrolase fold domain-containing protein [Micromonospora maris]|uniref:alpha/beta hydrolase fold domain-containing protein n=1 Tax=Micromonospora maris TaxID=1003110 RepID=UPI002E1503E6|nr:alpha/beta hydrolase fold domain-containing protein [Micromonospora maris]WSK45188.1 alpha/beta hydrolase [Micromonospora maris]